MVKLSDLNTNKQDLMRGKNVQLPTPTNFEDLNSYVASIQQILSKKKNRNKPLFQNWIKGSYEPTREYETI